MTAREVPVVSVPSEPTMEMTIAGFECEAFDMLMDAANQKGGWPFACWEAAGLVNAIYAAMLGAAPTRARPLDRDAVPWRLAMRVLQSDLYAQLDDAERAECDALVALNPALKSPEKV